MNIKPNQTGTKNFICHYLSIIVLLLFTSCVSTKYIDIEVLRPAKISVPPEIKNVIIIDNSISVADTLPEISKLPLQRIEMSKVPYMLGKSFEPFVDTLSTVAINELLNELNRREFFDTVFIDIKSIKDSFNYLSKKSIDKKYLFALKDIYNIDAAIVLDSFIYKPKFSIENLDELGSTYFTQKVSGAINWKFINMMDTTLMDNYVQQENLIWDYYIDNYQYLKKKIPKLNQSLHELADYMGYYYADRITPYWEPVERYYYKSLHGLFSYANKHVKNNDWSEAEKVWFYIFKTGNKLNSARAAHNIALSKEIQGQFRESVEWAYESYKGFKKIKNIYLIPYNRELDYYTKSAQRFNDKKKLNKQIGGD